LHTLFHGYIIGFEKVTKETKNGVIFLAAVSPLAIGSLLFLTLYIGFKKYPHN